MVPKERRVMLKKSVDILTDQIKRCTFCKECEKDCSIFLVTGKFAPYEKLQSVFDILKSNTKPLNWEAVFLCTKCEACDVSCPEGIPVTEIIDLGRSICVEKWGIQYPRQKSVAESIFKFGY